MPTILLIEDEPMLRAMIELALRLEGFRVVTASHADEALTLVRSIPGDVDLLIAEAQLPEIDGPTLAERLLVEDPAMRVLLLSGQMEDLPPGGWRHFEFLSKPFPLKTFLAEVHRLLRPLAVPSVP